MELIAVTNDKLEVDALVQAILEAEPYVDSVIIRERSKPAKEWIHLIQKLLASNVDKEKLIINDRVDVAAVTGLMKVQLPGNGLTIAQVKAHFSNLYAGRSVHSMSGAIKACQTGADWILYGHVFETDCKKGVPARGLEELKLMAENVPIDLYAIGGIRPEHIPLLKDTGVKGAAVMSAIFDTPNPASVAREYQQACKSLSSQYR